MTATMHTQTPPVEDDRGYDPSTSSAWTIVARRELTAKLTDRTFLIGTAVTAAIILVMVGLQAYLGGRTTTFEVAAQGEAASVVRQLAQTHDGGEDDVKVAFVETASADAARAAVKGGDADAWLAEADDGWTLTTAEPDPQLTSLVQAAVEDRAVQANAAQAGTTLEALQDGSALNSRLLDGQDSDQSFLTELAGFAFAFLFYLAAVMFGMTLAQSVVEEKQSRIVEIIAAAIPVRQLLIGKVLGNTVMAFGQMLLYVGLGLIGLSFTDLGRFLPSLSGSVAWFLVFFLAGFVALACLWAVAGALASRQEDLQATTTPLTMLLIAIFFGGLFLDGTAQTIASFVPPASAVLMPLRLLDGSAGWWEAGAALALLLAFAGATIVVGERLYRRALLQTQGRVGLRQAWNAAE